MKQFASGRFDRSDLKRLLEYDLSFGQLLDSKKQAQGLFKPYTMTFFSNKEFYKLINDILEIINHQSLMFRRNLLEFYVPLNCNYLWQKILCLWARKLSRF